MIGLLLAAALVSAPGTFSPEQIDQYAQAIKPLPTGTPLVIPPLSGVPAAGPAPLGAPALIATGAMAVLALPVFLRRPRGGTMNQSTGLWLTLLGISALTDFIISAGGALTTAMVATGTTSVPSMAVMIFATVTGLIAMARSLKATLEPPPTTTQTTDTMKTPTGSTTRETSVSTTTPAGAPPATPVPVLVSVPAPAPAPAPLIAPKPQAPPAGEWIQRGTEWVWVAKP